MSDPKPAPTAVDVDDLLAALPYEDRIPRECGDIAFDAPWELRVLALGVAMHNAGGYPWQDFQRTLIDSVKRWETACSPEQPWQYYERWLDTLERLLAERGIVGTAELDERTQTVLDTPVDKSHQHAHLDPIAIEHHH
jgi:nitrile hydratase accessory protein